MLSRRLLVAMAAAATVLAPKPSAALERNDDRDKRTDDRELDRLRRVAVTANPLALAINRWGANVEVLPIRHHAIVLSGYLQSFKLGHMRNLVPTALRENVRDDAPSLAGGELGYRLYSGRTGADGFFVGPSGVMVPLAYPRFASDGSGVELQPYRALGGALDVGVQRATKMGLTVGGGLGVMVLTSRLPPDPNRIAMPVAMNVLPRLLFTAGWAF